ncbi:Ribosomal protein L1p/L10e family [Citrus sinensis]|uniref:Ribosomal protein L1p/L10e family n=1 Tax=Citrus sinensis TaxID=2711 RepID=A0ACB8N0F5_CITSI|nr:Ribosomal protein L1p/L10e family [Citrus sinensis]
MAAVRLLLSQARRHCLTKPHASPSVTFQRTLCSSTAVQDDDESQNPPKQPIPVVSYASKPKDESNAPIENAQQQQNELQSDNPPHDFQAEEARTGLTREDIRYLKDVPTITPVSYPSRVAPLPEAGEPASGEAEGEGDGERRRIQSEKKTLRFMRVPEQAQVSVPYPLLIKPESKKKESRPVLDLMDAIKQVKANAKAKFDETVEAHVRLAIPPRKTELIVRGTMNLPHGDKKAVRVAFFAEGADAEEARAAGADIVGGLELIEEIASSGKLDVEKCFSTRQFMPRLFKISKILNQHGLMPNPKQGTVTNDVARAVQEAKQGHIKFKMDNTSNVHVGLGKVSLKEELLRENVGAFVNALLLAKPAGLKKTSKFAGYVNSFHMCSTMGPSFPVSIQSLSRALDQYNKVAH